MLVDIKMWGCIFPEIVVKPIFLIGIFLVKTYYIFPLVKNNLYSLKTLT